MLLNFIKKISSVRIYIPADLRPADNRYSVSQSVQVGHSAIALNSPTVPAVMLTHSVNASWNVLAHTSRMHIHMQYTRACTLLALLRHTKQIVEILVLHN